MWIKSRTITIVAGWKTEEMISGIDGVMSLAAASGSELATVSDIVTDGLSMFGMQAQDSARFADVLAAASANTNTNVEGLGEALKYVGASANAAGYDIEQTSAFLGMLADNGIKGSSAGTAMNAVLRDMKKKAEDGAIAIGDTAVAVYDAEGNMRGLSDIMADVEKATDGMTNAQRDAALMAIFGDEAMRGVNIALESGSEEMKRLEEVMYGAEGTAGDMAAMMQDNLNGSLTNLKSALEEVAIAIGTALIPYVEKAVEFVQKLVDKFNGLEDSTKETIAIVGLIAAAFLLIVGPLMLIVGFIPHMIGGFNALIGVFKAVGGAVTLVTSPIGLIVLGIVAVIAALVIAYNKFEWFRDVVDVVWQTIKEVIVQAAEAVWEFIQEIWTSISEFIVENQELIREAIDTAWKFIENVLKATMEFLEPFIVVAWENIKLAIETVWEAIKLIVKTAIELVKGIIKATMQIITGDWSGAWETIKNMFVNIWEHIKTFLKKTVENIKNTIQTQFERVRAIIKEKTEAAKQALISAFTEMLAKAIAKAAEIVTNMQEKFEQVKQAVKDKLTEAVTIVGEKIGEMVGKVTEKATDFYNAGKNIVKSIADGITGSIKLVTDAIGNVTAKIRNYLPFSPAKEGALKDIMNIRIAESIAESIDKGKNAAVKSMRGLTDELDSLIHFNPSMNDLSNQVEGIHRKARFNLTSDVNSQINVSKQPAQINVFVGSKQIASEIVDDISRLQSDQFNVRRASYGY